MEQRLAENNDMLLNAVMKAFDAHLIPNIKLNISSVWGEGKHHFPSGISSRYDYVLRWAHFTQDNRLNVIFCGHTEVSFHNKHPEHLA